MVISLNSKRKPIQYQCMSLLLAAPLIYKTELHPCFGPLYINNGENYYSHNCHFNSSWPGPVSELHNLLTLCYEGSFDETHFTDKETKIRIPAQDYMMPKPIILTTVLFWIFCLYPIFSPLFLGLHARGKSRKEKKKIPFLSKEVFKEWGLDLYSSVNKYS